MELCILIPAKDEEETIEETIVCIQQKLSNVIPFNILVVNDYSKDNTHHIVSELSKKYPNVYHLFNESENGVGSAIRFGLTKWKGDVISICMADGSESPEDIINSYKIIRDNNVDCVFGSRFTQNGKVTNYPLGKLILNRIFNHGVRIISGFRFNDFTNIFKTYHRRAIQKITPLRSRKFSIGLEMSLKAYKEGLSINVVPIKWKQRQAGSSKLNLRKNFIAYMGSLFSVIRNSLLQKIALITILSTYFIIGSIYSSKQGFWHDEIYTLTFLNGISIYEFEGSIWTEKKGIYNASFLKESLENDNFFSNFSTQITHEGHPPLYFISLKLWTYFFGSNELALRSFSLTCGILFFLILFNLFRQLSKKSYSAWILLAFLIFNPFLFYFFNEARMYAMSLLLASICFAFWMEYVKNKSIHSRAFLYFTLSSIGLLYTHYYGIFFILSIIFFDIARNGLSKSILNYFIPFICFLPWMGVIFNQVNLHHIHWTDGAVSFSQSMIGYFKGLINLFISPIENPTNIEYILVSFLFVSLSILLSYKKLKFAIILFLTISLYGFQIYLFDQVFDHHTILIPRYYIFVLIPIFWGLYVIIENSKIYSLIILAVIYVSLCTNVLIQIYNLDRSPKEMIREVAGYADQSIDMESRVLVFEPRGPLMFGVAYYLQNDFTMISADKAKINNIKNPVYIDERLGVNYRENLLHNNNQDSLNMIPFVGVFLYK